MQKTIECKANGKGIAYKEYVVIQYQRHPQLVICIAQNIFTYECRVSLASYLRGHTK